MRISYRRKKGVARARAGFTLFEVLVSLALTGVVAYVVFSMSQSLVKLWRQVGSDVTMEVDANFALDVIERDLESALFLDNGLPMFAVTALSAGESGRGWVSVADTTWTRDTTDDFLPNQHMYGWAGSWLRFFSAAPTVNAVSYQIVRRGTFSGADDLPAYILHRAVVRQDKTSDAGYNIVDEAYETGGSYVGHPKEIFKPNLSSYLIENVVDFGVRLHVYDESKKTNPDLNSPNGMRCVFPVFDPLVEDDIPEERSYPHMNEDETYEDITYPDAVEVFIRVLDKEGAEKLRAVELNQLPGETYRSVVDKHGRVFSRFVTCRVEGI